MAPKSKKDTKKGKGLEDKGKPTTDKKQEEKPEEKPEEQLEETTEEKPEDTIEEKTDEERNENKSGDDAADEKADDSETESIANDKMDQSKEADIENKVEDGKPDDDDDDDKASEVFEKDDAKGSEPEKDAVESDSQESDNEKVGMLDKPIEIFTEKRERKSRDFLTFTNEKKVKEEDKLDYSTGPGTMLKDIPFAKAQINQEPNEDLTTLYQLMYKKKPQLVSQTKKKILEFCGYPFEKESKLWKAHQALCDRLTKAGVRYINELLGLERKNKSRDDMQDDLFEYLQCPKDLGLEVPEYKTPVVGKRKSKRARGKGGKKGYVEISESEEDEDESDEEDSSSEEEKEKKKKSVKTAAKKENHKGKARKGKKSSEEDDDSSADENSSSSEDEEDKSNRSKSRKGPSKSVGKAANKKTPAKKTSNTKKTPVPEKNGGRRRPSKRTSYPSDDSSDEEVLVQSKKPKKSPAKKETPKKPPSNAELKKVITELLKDADLGKLTMKNILHQVYDRYTDFDLSTQKEFLKKTVKECL